MRTIMDELSKCGIRTRSEDEISTLASCRTPGRPGPPLVPVGPSDVAPGSVMRVWHEILNQWATGWLEVLFVVGDRIGMRDAAGNSTARYVSDTVPTAWRHPDFGPVRLLATSADASHDAAVTAGAKPPLTMGRRDVVPKTGRWGRCKACGLHVELPNAKEVVWDWDDVYAHAYYCPNCYTPANIYMGQLIGADTKHMVDQIPK